MTEPTRTPSGDLASPNREEHLKAIRAASEQRRAVLCPCGVLPRNCNEHADPTEPAARQALRTETP